MKKILSVLLMIILMSCTSNENTTQLRIWHTENDPKTQESFEKVAQILEKSNEELDIIYEYIPWGQLSQKLKLAMSSKNKTINMPDITHIQPYMAYSLYYNDLLLDITDVVDEINAYTENGINPAVKDLQKFNGRYYGIAQHVGVSFILYRKDILKKYGIDTPKTKEEFINTCKQLREKGHNYPIVLPGSSPFFMECILSEYLNTAGASIFDENIKANIANNKQVVEVLKYISEISEYVTPDYKTLGYLDQFDMILRPNGPIFIMFAGARSFQNFEKNINSASSDIVSALEPIRINNDSTPFTSIDCEPFVIINKNDKTKESYAKEWLKEFYKEENYMNFCESVPIQLMPIMEDMRSDYNKNNSVKKWKQWYDYANSMIDSKRVRPYFMLKNQRKDLDFLYELHNSNILYNLVLDAMSLREITDTTLIKYQNDINKMVDNVSRKKNGEYIN